MELFLHKNISEEQTLWWNLYSVTPQVTAQLYEIMQLTHHNVSGDKHRLHK